MICFSVAAASMTLLEALEPACEITVEKTYIHVWSGGIEWNSHYVKCCCIQSKYFRWQCNGGPCRMPASSKLHGLSVLVNSIKNEFNGAKKWLLHSRNFQQLWSPRAEITLVLYWQVYPVNMGWVNCLEWPLARVARVEQNDKLLGLVAAGVFWIYCRSIVDLRTGQDQWRRKAVKADCVVVPARNSEFQDHKGLIYHV